MVGACARVCGLHEWLGGWVDVCVSVCVLVVQCTIFELVDFSPVKVVCESTFSHSLFGVFALLSATIDTIHALHIKQITQITQKCIICARTLFAFFLSMLYYTARSQSAHIYMERSTFTFRQIHKNCNVYSDWVAFSFLFTVVLHFNKQTHARAHATFVCLAITKFGLHVYDR